MNFTVEERGGALWLELHEELTIQHVGELKEALSHAAENRLPLKVKASRLKKMHTATVQLLLAWKKNGNVMELVDSSAELRDFMGRIGVPVNNGEKR